MSTIFTKIISGEFSGMFAWADELCVVFATIEPISDGHVLVVPREEIVSFTEADDDLLAHLMKVAAIIGRAQEEAFEGSRAALIIAGFDVPHLHLHVIPARGEAQLSFANANGDATPDELTAATERLRETLRTQGYAANIPVEIGRPDLA